MGDDLKTGQTPTGQAPARPDNETFTVTAHRCEHCGAEKHSARALKVHITRHHGKPRTGKARRVPRSAQPAVRPSAGSARQIFEALAQHLDETDEFTSCCLLGLDVLSGKLKTLRLSYLKKSARLMKLVQEVKRLRWEVRKPTEEFETPDDEEKNREDD